MRNSMIWKNLMKKTNNKSLLIIKNKEWHCNATLYFLGYFLGITAIDNST